MATSIGKGVDVKRFIATPAFLIIAGLIAVWAVWKLFLHPSARAAGAATPGSVVANPGASATQPSVSGDAGTMGTLGDIQRQISTFEQELATLGSQAVPTTPAPGQPPSPSPSPITNFGNFLLGGSPYEGAIGVPVYSGPSWQDKLLGWLPFGGQLAASGSPVQGLSAGGWGRAPSTEYEPTTYAGQTGYVSRVDVASALGPGF